MGTKTIKQFDSLTASDIEGDDLLPVWDTSLDMTKHITVTEFKKLTADTETLTISSNAITLTKKSSRLLVEVDCAGSSDELHQINGGTVCQEIVLQIKDNAKSITVKDNSGNIYLDGDFTLSNRRYILTCIVIAGNKIGELSRSPRA